MGLFDGFFGNGGGGSGSAGQIQMPPQPTREQVIATAQALGMTLTEPQIQALLVGRPATLSPDEQAQWYKLIEARGEQNKVYKVNVFKQMPASMRQYIIDSISWTTGMRLINQGAVQPTQQEKQLEHLAHKYNQLTEMLTGHSHPFSNMHNLHSALKQMAHEKSMGKQAVVFSVEGPCHYAEINLNENIITLKQLIEAHAEQCLADGITGDLNK